MRRYFILLHRWQVLPLSCEQVFILSPFAGLILPGHIFTTARKYWHANNLAQHASGKLAIGFSTQENRMGNFPPDWQEKKERKNNQRLASK